MERRSGSGEMKEEKVIKIKEGKANEQQLDGRR